MTDDRQPTTGQGYKFQRLEIYRLALDHVDITYTLVNALPKSEEFNLKSQLLRAATSVALNIAEGSTSQSDAEQTRFLGMALRSLVETVACRDIIARRGYAVSESLEASAELSQKLFAKIQAFRKALSPHGSRARSAVAGSQRSAVVGRQSIS